MNSKMENLLKEVEYELQFLNHEIGNNFDIEKINFREDLAELFSDEVKYTQNLDEISPAQLLLQKTDEALNQIYDKLFSQDKADFHINISGQNLSKIENKIDMNQLFKVIFDFLNTNNQNGEIDFFFQNYNQYKTQNDEFLEDLSLMLTEYHTKHKKMDRVIFNFNAFDSDQMRQITSPVSQKADMSQVFFVEKKSVSTALKIGLKMENAENRFKVDKTWIKTLDQKRQRYSKQNQDQTEKKLTIKIVQLNTSYKQRKNLLRNNFNNYINSNQ